MLPCPSEAPARLRIRLAEHRQAMDGPAAEGEVVAEVRWANSRGLTHVRTSDAYRLRYFSNCEARLSLDLTEIVLTLAHGRSEEDAALFLIGGITAFMFCLRGRPPLHGSAIARDGRTLAFLGASGAGKSTLAALYCLDGAALLADDLLAIGPDNRVLLGATEVRLRPLARELAESFPADRVRVSVDGRLAVRCTDALPDAPPIAALVTPVLSSEASDISVRKLDGAAAFLALASSPRQLGLKDPGLIRAAFGHFADIARRLPVFEAVVPAHRLRDPALPRDLDRQLDKLL